MNAGRRGFGAVSFFAILGVVMVAAGTRPAAQGPSEGIKVHGDWTIDVRNPDATLVSHHEFKNALTASDGSSVGGNGLLAGLLGGTLPARASWSIVLVGSWCEWGNFEPCEITEASSTLAIPSEFKTLVVEIPSVPFPYNHDWRIPTGQMILSGSAPASSSGEISHVRTAVPLCGGPPACVLAGLGKATFTSHTLASPIAVAQGQVVHVRVVISFS